MSKTMTKEGQLHAAYWALKLSFGLMSVVIGLDKFSHLLVEWGGYTAPFFVRLMPFNPTYFMYIAAVVEIVLGVAVLTRWTRTGAFLLGLWLLAVTVNMIAAGYYDIALRDWVITVGAFALAFMTPAAETQRTNRET